MNMSVDYVEDWYNHLNLYILFVFYGVTVEKNALVSNFQHYLLPRDISFGNNAGKFGSVPPVVLQGIVQNLISQKEVWEDAIVNYSWLISDAMPCRANIPSFFMSLPFKNSLKNGAKCTLRKE